MNAASFVAPTAVNATVGAAITQTTGLVNTVNSNISGAGNISAPSAASSIFIGGPSSINMGNIMPGGNLNFVNPIGH
jgi:hypothetical protein